MHEKFKNAKEYWDALTQGHDIIKIENPNEFWEDMDAEDMSFKELDELDEKERY